MEEQARRRPQGEHRSAIDGYSPIDDDGLDGAYDSVATDGEVSDCQCVPCPRPDRHFLLFAAFEQEEEAVVNGLWSVAARSEGGELDKDPDAVAFTHFKVACLTAVGVVEIDAIDIDPKAALVSSRQSYLPDA